MPINRRDLVSMAGLLGGAVLVANRADGQPPESPQPAEARGKVTMYSEGFSTNFTLSEMPEKIEKFAIDPRVSERLGRLVLAAAEKGWEVEVTYTRFPDGSGGSVYGVRVKDFRAH